MARNVVIMVYGDSLSMPRWEESIQCNNLYSELFRAWLEKENPNNKVYLYNRSQGGESIRFLYKTFKKDMEYFGDFGEKILILQCGVVDCAPRPIPFVLRRLISIMPINMRNFIIKCIHDNRATLLRMGFKWFITEVFKFKTIYRKWLEEAVPKFSKIYIFNILPTTNEIESHSPGFSESITVFNRQIAQVIKSLNKDNLYLIDVHANCQQSKDHFKNIVNKNDGHHLTLAGHQFYCDMLIQQEQKIICPK